MVRGLFQMALWVLMLVGSSGAKAQDLPLAPRDMSKVDIYLGTRDIGHHIYSKYGHTIVRVLDREAGTDIGYNWGTFDFNAPGFIPNFLRGYLIYYMSYGPWWNEVAISKIEQQTMWMERVNLTDTQKQRVIDRIMWHARPENVNYPYLFFYDNCSTRVRDIFDMATGGQIKKLSANKLTGKTYRDRVMEYNASEPFFAMGQDVILNSEPDKEMSDWEDMFIPGRLRHYMLSIPAVDDAGHEIPGKTLLSDTVTLTDYPGPEVPLINGYMLLWILSGVPAMLGVYMFKRPMTKSLGTRFIGFSALVLGGLWGSIGLFLSLSWAFGSHSVLPHNANLWMIWPVDLGYMALGIYFLTFGSSARLSPPRVLLVKYATFAHMACLVVLVALTVSGGLVQNTSRVVGWFAPLTALVWLSLLYVLVDQSRITTAKS
jgi:hypothetical protein